MRRERGTILGVTYLFVAVIISYTASMMTRSLTEQRVAQRSTNVSGALMMAEAGIDQAIANIRDGNSDSIDATELDNGSYAVDVTDLGGDRYQVDAYGTLGTDERHVEVIVEANGSSILLYPMFGELSVDLKKNTTTDSYNSSEGDYDPNTAGSNGHIGTNSTVDSSVDIAKDSVINGQIVVGVGGGASVATIDAKATVTANPDVAAADENLTLPAIDTSGMSCSSDLVIADGSTKTFTAGSYCYDDLDLGTGATIAVNGSDEVVLFVDSVDFSKSSTVNLSGKPTQFIMQVYGTSVNWDKEGTFVGAIYAPNAAINFKKSSTIYGAVVAQSIQVDKAMTFHYDEALEEYGPQSVEEVSTVSWREPSVNEE